MSGSSKFLIHEAQIEDIFRGQSVEPVTPEQVKNGDVLVHVFGIHQAVRLLILSVVELRGGEIMHGASQTITYCDSELGHADDIEIIPDNILEGTVDLRCLAPRSPEPGACYQLLKVLNPHLINFSLDEFTLPLYEIHYSGSDVNELRGYLKDLVEPVKREWVALLARERVDMSEQGLIFEFSIKDFEPEDLLLIDGIGWSFAELVYLYAFGQCSPETRGPSTFWVRLCLREGYEEHSTQAMEFMVSRLVEVYRDQFGLNIEYKMRTDKDDFLFS